MVCSHPAPKYQSSDQRLLPLPPEPLLLYHHPMEQRGTPWDTGVMASVLASYACLVETQAHSLFQKFACCETWLVQWLTLCTPSLCFLQLIFADTPLHLRVGSIRVDGRLRIGGPNCRAWHPITITFEQLQGLNTFDMGIQVRLMACRAC